MNQTDRRIYHFKGNPRAIGVAMGKSLGEKLEANIRRYTRRRPSQPEVLDLEKLHAGAMPYLRSLPVRFQEELEGMAQGANLPLQRLAEWVYIEAYLENECSGFVCLLDGQAWVGRNNDTFVPEMWGYVTIREVDGRIPAICFGMEGDVFTPTGINREKLWLHYNYLPAWDAPGGEKPHWPGYVWLSEALETCATLQDVEALLTQIDRDDGMLLFAVDGKQEEFAIFECTCASQVRRDPVEPWLVATNHCCLLEDPRSSGAEDSDSHRRYQRMEVLVKELYEDGSGVQIPQDFIRILADDVIERRGGDLVTAYANVACPGLGEHWYTFGGYPAASQGNWARLAWPW